MAVAERCLQGIGIVERLLVQRILINQLQGQLDQRTFQNTNITVESGSGCGGGALWSSEVGDGD